MSAEKVALDNEQAPAGPATPQADDAGGGGLSLKRWLLLAIAVILLTGAATVAPQFLKAPSRSLFPASKPKGPLPVTAIEPPNLVYDFGVMAQNTVGRHGWMIKNVGKAPLKLAKGPSSCSCTIANLPNGTEATVPPGKSVPVQLEWDTKESNGPFSKSATIYALNDPAHPEFEFVIRGVVRPAVVVMTDEETGILSFGAIDNDTPHTSQFVVYSPEKGDLKLTSWTTSNPEYITLTPQPMDPKELRAMILYELRSSQIDPQLLEAAAGYKVAVEIKPGMALGSFREELVVKTNHPLRPEVRVTAIGKVRGAVAIEPDYLKMRGVPAEQGQSRVLNIWVRSTNPVRFDVENELYSDDEMTVRANPQTLKVSIKPDDKQGTTAGTTVTGRRYRMVITVPPGAEPGEYKGILHVKTDHPGVREVKVPVEVSIAGAG